MSRMLIRCAAAALVTLLAVPALAEDEPDVDCDNAQAQQEMNFCAEKDFDAADADLNRIWKTAKAVMKKADEDVASYDENAVGAVDALMKAQRAWIDYRDGQCEAYAFQSRGGSMEPMLIMGCKADLTRERVKELEGLIEAFNGD